MEKTFRLIGILLIGGLIRWEIALAADDELKVIETAPQQAAEQPAQDQEQQKMVLAEPMPNSQDFDPTKYTLGPDDVVEIMVLRHPEFSGVYPINQEGKIQYKFVGDIEVTGLTKTDLEKKITGAISAYLVNPEVNVTIMEYKSKVIYVLGEVGAPGKYFMRAESIPIREAVVNAGLPTFSAAMRRCHLITPDKNGNPKTKMVDLYSVLYGGDLKKNLEMRPGDVLYVPATVMAKIIRIINPVTSAVGVTSSVPTDVKSGKSALTTMAK